MRKIISFFIFVLAVGFMNAQENFELSTLRIGPYKIFMDKKDAEKIAGTSLKITDGDKKNNVKYNGELIGILLSNGYGGEANPDGTVITGLSTTSKKFKTKSGMGIGNTKDELINTYRNYPHFNVNPAWDEETGKSLKEAGYFTLEDDDAGTQLIFKLVNNIVTEITVYINEGC